MPLPDYRLIPESTMETIQAWIGHGRPVGGFVEAVLKNDLAQAFARADEDNIRALFHTVAWLWNNAPANCWGSPERYTEWRLKHLRIREREADKYAESAIDNS